MMESLIMRLLLMTRTVYTLASISRILKKVAKEKVSKAKKRRRGVQVCPGRTVAEGCEERWLPNGTMKEYWVQFCTQNPSAKVSFPTFWRVPRQNFIYRFVYQDVCSLDTFP